MNAGTGSRRVAVAVVAALVGAMAAHSSAEDASAAKFGKRTLKPGMRGKDVRVLQRSLTILKLRTPATGRYKRRTKKSVRRLERRKTQEGRKAWRVDGRVQRREAKRIMRMVATVRARKRARAVAPGAQRFPVPGVHNFGGAIARFGAGRSGHSHQGQDVFAACGERLYSAQAGNVKAVGYQRSAAGHYVVVAGVDGLDYAYMHLQGASWATRGSWVYAGTQIGLVGQSGNASGCHLHFELWSAPGWYSGGAPFDPLPYLTYWDSYS